MVVVVNGDAYVDAMSIPTASRGTANPLADQDTGGEPEEEGVGRDAAGE